MDFKETDPQKKTFFILLFLAIIFIAGVVLVWQRFIQPKATAGVPSLFFETNPTTLQASANFDLSLKVNPNNTSFNAFELYITYDSSKVEFQNVSNQAESLNSSYLLVTKTVDATNNLITLIGTKTGTPFSGSTAVELAKVAMKVKAGVSGDIVFSWGANTKLGDNLTIEKQNGTFTVGSAGGGASVFFSSSASSYQPGQNFDLDINLNTNNQQVKAMDAVFFYDDAKVSFRGSSPEQSIVIDSASGFDTSLAIKTVDTTTKKITIGLAAQGGSNPTPVVGSDIKVATVQFTIKSGAQGTMSFAADTASTVYDLQTQNILTNRPTYSVTIGSVNATNTPTPTTEPGSTNTPIPGVNINLKLKFQGILKKPNTATIMPVKVTVSGKGTPGPQGRVGDFTVDENGIWSGRVDFVSFPPGSDYKVFVKGPKHLQKRVCDNAPSESFPGSYHCENGVITLAPGGNALDFSTIYQLVGDLPQQDGVVNSYDISLVRNNLGKSDAPTLALADLNLDGIVDSQDYSLVIAALSIRSDEGE